MTRLSDFPWDPDEVPPRILEEGQRYQIEGRVGEVYAVEGVIWGAIQGRQPYQTVIDQSPGNQDFVCSCPYIAAHPCKHVIALAHVENKVSTRSIPPDLLRVNIYRCAQSLKQGLSGDWTRRMEGFAQNDDDLNVLALWLAGVEAGIDPKNRESALECWKQAFRRNGSIDLKARVLRVNLLFACWTRRQTHTGIRKPVAFPVRTYTPVVRLLVTDAHSAHHLRIKLQGWSLDVPEWEELLRL